MWNCWVDQCLKLFMLLLHVRQTGSKIWRTATTASYLQSFHRGYCTNCVWKVERFLELGSGGGSPVVSREDVGEAEARLQRVSRPRPGSPLCACPSQDTVAPRSQWLGLALLLLSTSSSLEIIFLQKAIWNFYNEKGNFWLKSGLNREACGRSLINVVYHTSGPAPQEDNGCGGGAGDQRTLRHAEG